MGGFILGPYTKVGYQVPDNQASNILAKCHRSFWQLRKGPSKDSRGTTSRPLGESVRILGDMLSFLRSCHRSMPVCETRCTRAGTDGASTTCYCACCPTRLVPPALLDLLMITKRAIMKVVSSEAVSIDHAAQNEFHAAFDDPVFAACCIANNTGHLLVRPPETLHLCKTSTTKS